MPSLGMQPIICVRFLFQILFELNGSAFGMSRLVVLLKIPAGCERWILSEIH